MRKSSLFSISCGLTAADVSREYAVERGGSRCLEGQVRWADRVGGASNAPVGKGESSPKALSRRCVVGQRSAEGGAKKSYHHAEVHLIT